MKRIRIAVESCNRISFWMFVPLGTVLIFAGFVKDGGFGVVAAVIALCAVSLLIGMIKAATSALYFAAIVYEKNVILGELVWRAGKMFISARYGRAEASEVKKEKTGKMLHIWGFLLPEYCQERYLKPALEEMKEQRILSTLEAETVCQKGFIDCCFYIKLTVAYFYTLLCLFRDGMAKVSPVLKWFFTGPLR